MAASSQSFLFKKLEPEKQPIRLVYHLLMGDEGDRTPGLTYIRGNHVGEVCMYRRLKHVCMMHSLRARSYRVSSCDKILRFLSENLCIPMGFSHLRLEPWMVVPKEALEYLSACGRGGVHLT